MFCNQCGAVNTDGSRFCSDCGLPIAASTSGKKSAGDASGRQTIYVLPIGTIPADRYRILETLGMGGMGQVYLAADQKLETRVAIKVMLEVLSRDPGSLKRFIAEARHSMTLSHPNVVRVHNFEDGEMVKFLVMEYVEGETLAGRIAEQGRLTEEEARRIAIEACKGLEHAHERKVIHRDIKPQNILLGESGAVKIADFGIARVCRDSASRHNSQVDSGTLLYMSPEQLIGKSNEASDIYSLGVVLYEMLAGQPPFQSGDITYQIRQIVPDSPEGVSPELSAIVLKCLEKNPERRFASARALREELDGTADGRRMEEERHAAEVRRAEEDRLRAELQRKAEEARQHAEEQRIQIVASLGNRTEMEFVSIPAGKFMMGCSPGDSQCQDDEKPRHEVTISRGFELGKYAVIQDQWVKIMGKNPSEFKGDDRLPVENVTWNDALRFIKKLNALNDGYRYRLPTEAQWEYAARGGTTGPQYDDLDAIAWYTNNSGGKMHRVGQKKPNSFGLYDMLGNVWEWCSDWYGESYYSRSPAADPDGPSSGRSRVIRGGFYIQLRCDTRVSFRNCPGPYGYGAIGLRVCREKL